jgi:peroxiredoxin
MKAYRSRYADLEALDAQVIAVSSDSLETQKRFKAETGAQFSFVADPNGELIRQFGVKMPVVGMAMRHTFVVGPGRKLMHTESGGNAIDPGNVIKALSR